MLAALGIGMGGGGGSDGTAIGSNSTCKGAQHPKVTQTATSSHKLELAAQAAAFSTLCARVDATLNYEGYGRNTFGNVFQACPFSETHRIKRETESIFRMPGWHCDDSSGFYIIQSRRLRWGRTLPAVLRRGSLGSEDL